MQRKILIYTYFCPSNSHCPGGVQRVLQPLLSSLESIGWEIAIIHPEPKCECINHHTFPNIDHPEESDSYNSINLIKAADILRYESQFCDVIMSVDRVLPCQVVIPNVLMSNTLNYRTEADAFRSGNWFRVIAPTNSYKSKLKSINPNASISVVPYGFTKEFIDIALSCNTYKLGEELIVHLPHRPDVRKGHIEAIQGLAKIYSKARNIILEISWLDENRYSAYRSKLEKLIEQCGVLEQVKFLTWQNGIERLNSIYKSNATLQLGTFEESFGISAIESLLFGRPVVSRHQEAVREIAGLTELLIETANPCDWYNSLMRLEYDSNFVRNHLSYRTKLAEMLSLERMARQYHEILLEVIQST